MTEILFALLGVFLMFLGLAGVFIPLLPGVPLAWAGLLLYAFATDFSVISLSVILIFLFLTLLVAGIDIIAPIIGAKKFDASKYGIIGATLGFIVGVFTLGPIGIIAGPFLGAFLGEYFSGKEVSRAGRSAFGTFIGFLTGSLIKLALILVMVGFLVASLF